MDKKVKLAVVQGQRDNLENQIATALFTEFDDQELNNKLKDINDKLKPKAGLKLVSDEFQTPQDVR